MEQVKKPFATAEGLTLKTPAGAVFEDVNFTVNAGEVCALFGSAGSGKTALLLTLGARMKLAEGAASVGGYDLRHDKKQVRGLSGITVIQRINDVPEHLSVKDILSSDLYLAGKSGNAKSVDAYLRAWHFFAQKDAQYFSLSAEERIYFDVMLACTADPKLLLVDDIQDSLTQHASLKMVDLFKQLAKDKGITTLFGTNEYEIAEQADCLVVMSVGAKEQREAVIARSGEEGQPRLAGWANYAEQGVDRHPGKSSLFKKRVV